MLSQWPTHSILNAIPVWHQLAVLPASNLCLRAKTIRCSEAAGWCLDDIVLRWLPMPASAVPLSLSPVLTAVVSTLSLVCLCQRPGGIRGWSSAVLAFDSTCGYPGEGPSPHSRDISSYFAKPMTKPKQPAKPAAPVTRSNISMTSKRPRFEPRAVTHMTQSHMPIDVDSPGWSCDSCTRDNVAECVACASCGAGRHDSDVLFGGDNPNVETEASRLQRAYDEARFIVDFSFGVSVVPGYETFAIADLDEHMQAASIPLSNDSYSEMLIRRQFIRM